MSQLRGFKFKIYPTSNQIQIFDHTFYVYNRAWNKLLAAYTNFREELNTIPFVEKNSLFNFYTKDPVGKKDTTTRNEMYFNGFLNHKRNTGEINDKGNKLGYNLYNEFKNENGDYYEPYNQLPAMVMDQVIDTLKKAFEKMTDGAGFPKFKSYNKTLNKVIGEASFTYRYPNSIQTNDKFRFTDDVNKIGFKKIELPWGGKIKVTDKNGNVKNKLINLGLVKIKQHRLFPDDHVITSYTISRDTQNNYFISFTIKSDKFEELDKNANLDPNTKLDIIGVDRNATGNHITTSNEALNATTYNNELLFDISTNDVELYKKIQKEQRRLSTIRTNIGLRLYGDTFKTTTTKIPYDKLTSKYHSQKKKVSKLYKKIRNRKVDKINNIAHVLSNNANLIIFENLKIANMIKSPKPKKDDKGKYVENGKKAKSGLNNLLGKSNLYEIMNKTEIKAGQRNSIVDTVDPKYTSRTCPECNHVNQDIKQHNKHKKNKLFVCECCTYTNHSDLTAAIIIENKYVQTVDNNELINVSL
jgi:transposase